jgi:alpha-N-arabinofuranosidase
LKAKLRIDGDLRISNIDPRMYGSLLEHLGRAVYTGVYQPDHKLADSDGFRTDVINAVNRLNVPIIRYPGGNFLSGYNWEDGIGPKKERPVRLDLAWRSIETNQFGLHEFMKWTHKVGAKPDMGVNLGTRGIDAARNLVEYCNYPSGTYWSDLRIKNGAKEPFNIKTWSLGNEMDGDWQIGHKTADEYGRLAHETAKVMKLVDPTIELIASGSSLRTMKTFGSWEETVLDYTYDDVDYLSLHQYYGNEENNLEEFLGKSVDLDEFIQDIIAVADAVKARKHSKKTINLSFDEWNVWYHSHKQDDETEPWQIGPHLLEDHYNFEDALLVGSMMMTLLKHADRVKIACLAQLVNVIAPIMTNNDGTPSVWYQSIFYPFMQLSNYGQGEVLQTSVDVPSYKTKSVEDVPYIDSVSIVNEQSNELIIFVENKARETIDFSANIQNLKPISIILATEFAGYDLKQTNEDQQMEIKFHESVKIANDMLEACLKPLSWNMFRIKIA